MSDPLRDRQPVSTLAKNRQMIEFADKIDSFERLAEALEAELAVLPREDRPPDWRAAPLTGRLVFGFADGDSGPAALDVEVEATLTGVCQRCLAAFEWQLAVGERVLFSWQDAPVAERDGFERWELDDATIRPIDVVDELVTLALPLSVRHDDAACRMEAATPVAETETISPFANLRAQMDEDRKD